MADAKKPDEKEAQSPAAPPDAAAGAELTDEQLDKVAGGLAAMRFNRPVARPFSDAFSN